MWELIAEKKGDVHQALAQGQIEKVQRFLRDPGKTDLFYGFENLARSLNTEGPGLEPHSIKIYQDLLYLLRRLGKATVESRKCRNLPLPPIDKLLALIDEGVGHCVEFPNPFPGEIGSYSVPAASSVTAPFRRFTKRGEFIVL
jgi:hypothetical protein